MVHFPKIGFLLAFLVQNALFAQSTLPTQPKLIVGIVVDQMRYDYLYRYRAKYGPDGFNRFLREGFSCENTHYNYVPTYTGPGHAAIYSGTTPAVNGIISNDWWDPEWADHRYVTADKRYKTVGAPGKMGEHSPSVLLSTTITDELRLSNHFQSKVVGVCLKDRGGILPAGHIPNACYWYDDATGNWITSTYYPDSLGLPQWVQNFNNRRLPQEYLAMPWETLHPEATYSESFANWEKFEKRWKGSNGKFPHNMEALQRSAGGFGLLRVIPMGSTFTLDFALESIEQMQLGADEHPDFLCLSFSSTDYCAHQFGIHALETQDSYLRLDLEIARLFNYLDKKFGKDNVLVFLTADHGGTETPAHLKELRIPAGVQDETPLDSVLNTALLTKFKKKNVDFIHAVANQQVWFDRAALRSAKITLADASATVTEVLRQLPGVYDAFSRERLENLPNEYPFVSLVRLGIHPRRSGDVIFVLDPAWHPDGYFLTGGATHGSSYAYDTHVPLLWRGWKIRPGETFAPVNITDIAPTLSALLRIMEPNGTTGKVIQEVVKQ